jgi:hypothetical protein
LIELIPQLNIDPQYLSPEARKIYEEIIQIQQSA